MVRLHKNNIFSLVTLLYLYIPIVIFLLTWLKPLIGIPCVLISCLIIVAGSSFLKEEAISWKKLWGFLTISIVVIVAWSLLSGLGGFFQQSYDWQKHNVLLNDFGRL